MQGFDSSCGKEPQKELSPQPWEEAPPVDFGLWKTKRDTDAGELAIEV